jgi:hypothetical protein
VLVAGGVGLLTFESMRLAKIDPFAALRTQTGEEEKLAFSMTNVKVTHYRGSKLITRADVDRFTVMKDRQKMHLEGVHNGIYRGEEGEIKFDGKTADWNAGRKRLEVTSGAHVVNADFDLKVPKFTFDAFRSRLDVPGEVTGHISDGEIKAVGFAYNTKTHNWRTGKSDWIGYFALLPQDDPAAKREKWHVMGGLSDTVNGIETTLDGYAESDDSIVKADKIERNLKTKVITATGKVFYYSGKANMTCDKAVIYTDEKRAVLTGNVNMIVKPKDGDSKPKVEEIPPFRPMVPDAVAEKRPAAPPEGSDTDPVRDKQTIRKYPMSLLADKIEYWYKKGVRHGIATGSPQAYQNLPQNGWRRVWTHVALYDAEAETLEMKSDDGKRTRMRNSIGDDATATWVKLSTKEDDDEMHAKDMKGDFYNDDQNQDTGPTKPPPAFEKALIAPSLPQGSNPPTKVKTGHGGLQGPIGGAIVMAPRRSPQKHLPKKIWPW